NTSTSLLRSHLTFYSCVSYLKDPATTEIYTLSLHDALPIYVRIEERLDLAVRGRDFGREGHHRRGGPADRIGIGRCQRRQPPLRLGDDVLDEARDYPPDQFIGGPVDFEPRMKSLDFIEQAGEEGQRPEILQSKEPCPQPVVDGVRIIGNVVGQRRSLRLGGGKTVEPEILLLLVFEDSDRDAGVGVAVGRAAIGPEQRPVMLH